MHYFFADYNWIERQIHAHERALRALGITHICYIQRGGLFPAFVAAQMLDIQALHRLEYNRATRRVQCDTISELPQDAVILLCEDVCGSGWTMSDCLAYLQARFATVKTLAIQHFTGSRVVPDFGHYSGDTIFIFPWERHTVNRELRENYAVTHVQEGPDSAHHKYGADLDGVFLPDMPDDGYRDNLEETLLKRAALSPYAHDTRPHKTGSGWLIISGRPVDDYEATHDWLKRHNIAFTKLLLRDTTVHPLSPEDDPHTRALAAARAKASHISAEGITHFYESDALQAIFLASILPFVRVYWWNNHTGMRKHITAEDYA